jgi:hypothetical protein
MSRLTPFGFFFCFRGVARMGCDRSWEYSPDLAAEEDDETF